MKKPEDTSKRDPLDRLAALGFFGDAKQTSEEQIVEDERRGGAELVAADVVPTKGSEALEPLGFELGEIVAEDPIFREVVTPAGWERELGENPYGYWSYLVDPDGYRRVAMFYKAAFYDRHAHLSVLAEPYRADES